MYDEIVSKLKGQGIKFEEGLSCQEIEIVQRKYGIKFPESLRLFYQNALPISEGFYNWRKCSQENVSYIKSVMKKPFKDIVECCDEVDWCEEWGEEPIKLEKRRLAILSMVREAPKLIPIFSHRYMADVQISKSPIFSVCGTDIIYYAKDLLSYFEIEFKLRAHEKILINEVSHIPFWSDLL